MTDESQAEDLLEDNDVLENEHEEQEQIEPQQKPEPTGYLDKDAWIAAGKDPDKWVSKEVHAARGEHIQQTRALKREFENQIKNLNLLHEVQLRQQREALMSKRDDAIDIADKDAVRAIDKQIKELDKLEALTQVEQTPSKPPEVLEWEADNPWCHDANDPRLTLANRIYMDAVNGGKTIATALRMVDKEISSKFSDRRSSQGQIVEGSRTSTSRKTGDDPITMKSLTAEEKKIWEANLFPTEKEFLKAVANSRKGK